MVVSLHYHYGVEVSTGPRVRPMPQRRAGNSLSLVKMAKEIFAEPATLRLLSCLSYSLTSLCTFRPRYYANLLKSLPKKELKFTIEKHIMRSEKNRKARKDEVCSLKNI